MDVLSRETQNGEDAKRRGGVPDRTYKDDAQSQSMSSYEVPEPIINSPFDEPQQHW
jgi:hypothetical protein